MKANHNSEYYRQWSDDLPHGVSQVFVKDIRDRENFFMATNCYGEFVINNLTFDKLGYFNPAIDLLDAFCVIQNCGDLTFGQEYALECLWHEILHNKTYKLWSTNMSNEEVRFNETLHQFIARHQYPVFIERLGGKAINQADVISKGFGYREGVSRLSFLLDFYDVDFVHFAKEVGDNYIRNPNELRKGMVKYMVEHKNLEEEFVDVEFFDYITRIISQK